MEELGSIAENTLVVYDSINQKPIVKNRGIYLYYYENHGEEFTIIKKKLKRIRVSSKDSELSC